MKVNVSDVLELRKRVDVEGRRGRRSRIRQEDCELACQILTDLTSDMCNSVRRKGELFSREELKNLMNLIEKLNDIRVSYHKKGSDEDTNKEAV